MLIYTDKFNEIYKQPEYSKPTEELIDFPLVLDLELKHDRGEFMRPQIFYEVLNQAREFGTKGLNLGGMGDPMAHRNVINFIRNIRREKLYVSLTTPGHLLYLAVDSICNSGLNTLNVVVNPQRYRAVKSPLEVIYKKRKFGPFIRILQREGESVSGEFDEISDEFEMPKPDPMASWRKMMIAWDGKVFIEHFVNQNFIGNVEENLYELWHLEKAQLVRNKE